VQPVTTIKSNAWRQLEHQIFGGEAVLGQSGGTSYLLDSSDTAGSLVNMQWEPEERSCYMKLKNMLNGFNSPGFG
jgi:hypothetical protein